MALLYLLRGISNEDISILDICSNRSNSWNTGGNYLSLLFNYPWNSLFHNAGNMSVIKANSKRGGLV